MTWIKGRLFRCGAAIFWMPPPCGTNGATVPPARLAPYSGLANRLCVGQIRFGPAAWLADSAGTGYRPKGYILDENDQPTFRYHIYGATVSDAIRVMDNGQGLHRELTVQNPSGGKLYARLAEGATIEEKSDGMYVVVREANGRKELVVPVKDKVGYAILF